MAEKLLNCCRVRNLLKARMNNVFIQLSVDYIADRTAAEERIRMYARFEVYSRISVDLVRTT